MFSKFSKVKPTTRVRKWGKNTQKEAQLDNYVKIYSKVGIGY